MKLSWSHKLFFKINNLIGQHTMLDRVGYFCAQWLIYIFGIVVLSWGVFVLSSVDEQEFIMMMKLLLTSLVTAELISFAIALLWKHPRPVIEFPDIKVLLHTVETWKSFPSDHTIISFIIAFVAFIVGAPLILCILFLIVACAISLGRVFVGVHYPRDVVIGIILAGIVVYISPWIVAVVTQPVYDIVKTLFI